MEATERLAEISAGLSLVFTLKMLHDLPLIRSFSDNLRPA
jgi:hypothetical protein